MQPFDVAEIVDVRGRMRRTVANGKRIPRIPGRAADDIATDGRALEVDDIIRRHRPAAARDVARDGRVLNVDDILRSGAARLCAHDIAGHIGSDVHRIMLRIPRRRDGTHDGIRRRRR